MVGAAKVIEVDSLLVKCPHCGAWPMAANVQKANSVREIRFRCPDCHRQEASYLRAAGPGRLPMPDRHPQAPGT
jgi:transposase-like protein